MPRLSMSPLAAHTFGLGGCGGGGGSGGGGGGEYWQWWWRWWCSGAVLIVAVPNLLWL